MGWMFLCNLLIVNCKDTINISFPQLFQRFSYTELTLNTILLSHTAEINIYHKDRDMPQKLYPILNIRHWRKWRKRHNLQC